MTQIPGVYVEVKGDLAQLKKDMGQAKQIVTESAASISNSMNNALSGAQVKKGINSLIADLGTLSRSSKITGADFAKLGVDLGSLQKMTGTSSAEFAKLQSQLLKTQAANAQEKALKGIATAAGLTSKEIATLGKQFGLSQAQIANVTASTSKAGSAFSGLVGYVTPAIAGFVAFQQIISAVSQEFVYGLKAVEEFGMSVAQSTALITTFSQRAKDGDLAGAYIEANNYAKQLALTLETIDQKTIANSKDLRAMSETFIANGVLLDTNNKKQVEGFTAVANALAIMTQGQNKEIQMRQEIRGLMDGEIRSQDKLGMLLKAQIPDIEKQLVKWREQGTTLENLGKLLEGFNATTGLLENQWATVGSTMETIHNRILRGMFEPVFNDLIELAKQLNRSLMDTEGNLTPLARGLVALANDGYEAAKKMSGALTSPLKNMVPGLAAATAAWKTVGAEVDFVTGAIEDYGRTSEEHVRGKIADLQAELNSLQSGDLKWYEEFLPEDVISSKVTAIKTELQDLQATLREIEDGGDSWTSTPSSAPKIAPPPAETTSKSKASDLNAALQAETELIKAAEEKKLAIVQASISQDQQANQNAYELGLSSYSEYLTEKNRLTQDSLKAELAAAEKSLAAAQSAAANLAPITDKDGNARPDKDAKAEADAYKKVEDAEKAVLEARNKLTEAEVEGSHQSVMAAKEMSDSYKQTEIQLLEMQGKTIEAAQLQAEYDEESVERQRLIREAQKGNAEAQAALDAQRLMSANKIREAELDDLAAKQEAALAIAEIDGEYYKSLDIQTDLLDIEIQRAILAGALPEQIALLQKQRQELERMKAPLSAMVKGWEDVVKEQKTASELMYDLGHETAQDLYDTFSDTFFFAMKGDFEEIGDVWKDLLDRMLDNFLRMLADMAAAWAANQVFTWIFGSGTGVTINASGGSSGGVSASGVAGSVTSAVVSKGLEKYVWTPIYDSVASYLTGPAMSSTAAASGGSIAAGATSSGVAAGTATPALMDAYATGAGAGTTASTAGATGSTTVVVEEMSATIGTSSAAEGTTAGLGAASQLGIGAALMAAVAMVGLNQMANDIQTKNSFGHEDPGAVASGLGLTDSLTTITSEKSSQALEQFNMDIKQFGAVSLDAANGVMVATNALAGPGGFIEGTEFGMYSWDEASKTWYKGTVESRHAWDEMIASMEQMKPASEEAAAANAKVIASLAGVPTVADELTTAFLATEAWAKSVSEQVTNTALSMVSDNKARDDDGINGNWYGLSEQKTTQEWSDIISSGDLESTVAAMIGFNDSLTLVNEGLTGTMTTLTGSEGLIDAIQSQIQIFDASTGSYVTQSDLFGRMVSEMQGMGPVTSESIAATAAYIAEMHGVPEKASELALAFQLVMGGMTNLGAAAIGTAGDIAAAAAIARDSGGGGGDSSYTPESYTPEAYEPVGHAKGGIWAGWTMVGEQGPELVYTPPSRIFSNTDTNSILAGLKEQGSGGGQTVIHNHFHVNGREIATAIMPEVDKHVASKAARGQLGQRTVF